MWYLVLKAALSGVIVMIVSEVAKRSPAFGALIVSLPLVSILGIMWLWNDTQDPERIAAHAYATFWYVLPSMPMFLVFPYLLRHGVEFWIGLLASCALTVVLYFLFVWFLPKIGVTM